MTGYGAGLAEGGGLRIESEIHSINHRSLLLQLNAPRDWGALETELLAFFRRHLERGKLTVSLAVSRIDPEGAPDADWDEISRRVALYREARRRFGGDEAPAGENSTPPPEVLYRILCDSQREGSAPGWADAQEVALRSLEQATRRLVEMRQEEGQRLREEVAARIALLENALERIREWDAGRIPNHRDALLARLREMDLDLDLSDERVAREVAFLADRSDISEELVRISSHIEGLSDCLAAEGSPVGRKMEFILQELHREFNTVGSKASIAAMADQVIAAKQEIEKLREQAANIE